MIFENIVYTDSKNAVRSFETPNYLFFLSSIMIYFFAKDSFFVLSYGVILMSKIFISYRRESGQYLGQLLFNYLTEAGKDVFFDTESMKTGRFDKQIIQNIDESDVFIALFTTFLSTHFALA